MALHRLILRLDYAAACFQVIDSTGKILSSMQEALGADQIELKENFKGRMAWAEFNSPDVYYQVAMTPLQASFGIEFVDGFDLSGAVVHERIDRLFRLTYNLLSEFKITRFSRIGVRGFFVATAGWVRTPEDFGAKIDPRFTRMAEATIGKPTDFAIALDGAADDNTKYTLKVGPFGPLDLEKSFPKVHEQMKDVNGNLIVDIDQWSEAASLNVNPAKWAMPRLLRALHWFDGLKTVEVSHDP